MNSENVAQQPKETMSLIFLFEVSANNKSLTI